MSVERNVLAGSGAHSALRALAVTLALGIPVQEAHGFGVASTSPGRYALGVPVELATISVTFDAPPTVPAGAVRVAGYMSGLHGGTASVVGNTLTFTNVSEPFFPGELVFVNLRDTITSGASSLLGGHFFAFTIRSGAIANPVWANPRTFATADRPYFIHGGDLDNDGTPDIALPNEDSNDLSVLLNVSAGHFPAHVDYPVGTTPSSVFGEDFNNDGNQDLATADIASSTMSVLLNTGGGAFAPAQTYASGLTTRQIHGGDFDGDNDIDLCTTSRNSNQVFLFYNHGDGTFAAGVPYNGVGTGPFAIRTGDFNEDGHLDIAVANQDSGNLSILTNNGIGNFSTTGTYAIGSGPWCLNGNDFDGDGDFDLVSVASFGNRIVVLVNNGAGQFPVRRQTATGTFPLGVYAADLDGDGDIDATSSNFSGASVDVFMNDGGGVLALYTSLALPQSGTYAWASDLDADGDLDIATVDELADILRVYLTEGAAVSTEEPITDVRTELGVRARPNPLPSGRILEVLVRTAGGELDGTATFGGAPEVVVIAADGRLVRRLTGGRRTMEGWTFAWDGSLSGGEPAAPGVYFVRANEGTPARVQVLP